MLIKVYESNEFVTPKNFDERVVIFQCAHNIEDKSFDTFTKECMTKEILIDSFYTLNLIANRREIAKNVNKDFLEEIEEIEFDILYEVWDMLKDLLIDKDFRVPKTIKKAYRIYDHDWSYLFYAIESEEGFFAYNWSSYQ